MTLVVLGHGMVLQELLQMLVGVAPDVADGDARVLGFVAHDLDEIAAAFLGQRRHRNADQITARRGIEPEVRVADRLFDGAELRLLIGLDDDETRLGDVLGSLRFWCFAAAFFFTPLSNFMVTTQQVAHIVEAGPIPAMHGVVRWRACDLIMQLHEKFAISVADDTVYRALKELGFSHVSARPKAYRQDPEAMEAFKKTLPSVWRKSARSLPRAHR